MIRPADNAKESGCDVLFELKFVKLVARHERGNKNWVLSNELIKDELPP